MVRRSAEPAQSVEAANVEVQIPSTPPLGSSKKLYSMNDGSGQADKSAFVSPPPPSSSMTPPPSTQPGRLPSPTTRPQASQNDILLSSPPPTIKFAASGRLPNAETIANADIEELRSIAQGLVQAVNEARMSAAHFKLQHSLLTIETQESAQRAEVEHQMTRREVEVLQAADQKHRVNLSSNSRMSQTPSQTQVDALAKTCKELEEEREAADRRLRRAKKLIEIEKDRSDLLLEEVLLLKKRIRENRDHFSRMKTSSPMYTTPRDAFTTPQRKAMSRYTDTTPSHAPFAALLAADQVLSQESLSVPSTPTRLQVSKVKQGHTRGAHSLSSLHTTPARASRPVTSDGFPDPRLAYSAPGSQLVNESAERERHDRDSTISVSDDDDAGSDGDLIQSQASSLATSMLRKNPGSQESLRLSQNAEQSSNLLQTKIFGIAKKPGMERITRKRQTSGGEADIAVKKAKMTEGVGLGIGAWSPGA